MSATKSKKTPRMLVFDPAGGVSGDMFLGSLFALGVKVAPVQKEVASLPGLEAFRIISGRVKRRGIVAQRARVSCQAKGHSRNLSDILRMIRRSSLIPPVQEMASRTFNLLGGAEGKIHGVPPQKVHFHEVGAVDSIVDIVGAAVALSHLDFPRLYHRPFRLGSGIITIAHGRLPLPAPATLEVLRGRTVTLSGERGEIVTPTGAALLVALAEELPSGLSFTPEKVVYAAGTREGDPGAGMLRVVAAADPSRGREITVIRTTLDDLNPEVYGYVLERLFEEGARDVYLTQVQMKKNRPGVLLTVLCDPDLRERLVSLIFAETTTLGVRITREERTELERWSDRRDTPYGAVEVKCGTWGGGEIKISPEYESCREAARRHGVPLREVYRAVESAIAPGKGGKKGRMSPSRPAKSIGRKKKR
ncbi:MAG: nickel pincer cofactor biosynthesis protein LarC [Candidatus Krumholzibacteriota bacterium]|nr:nickel pincer cofactor biosynthesis protein LarC [Candidatus Krumholzibacteriota bacterium]